MKNLQVDDEFYKKLSKYAVFIPIINIDGKDHILFEVRSNLISQAGEVSFPGGGVNEGEKFELAAIRECREELNLDEKDVSLVDYSSMILSSSNRLIKAYYGRINKDFENISYNMEVDSIFTVSIDYLKKNPPEKYTAKLKMDLPDDFPFEKIPNGKNYNFWQRNHTFYFYNTKPVIWGMTANVLKDFLKFYK
ncbi:CoA pyrophosphatase [Anaerococcus vaginalis]|uniref:NUDIX hydrolase n=1 Tax=Anaerococcus vaginalis TaxID=33037 RepID=UPI002912B2AC|nr:CoA pyrophosphatase [Anaerococcus vaginalis]MDU6546832.1 CoA pyrophosphatase [Anaerococcus vaginalis]